MLAQNLIVILALALSLTVSATPLTARQTASGNDGDGNQVVGNGGQNAGSITANNAIGSDSIVLQAVWVCGNAQLNCCNRVEDKGDTTNAEMIGAFIGSGDINIQCTPINIAAIAIQAPINKACDAEAACCQREISQDGSVSLRCVALAALL